MSEASDKKAVVLLSGGLDSATTLALAREAGFACYALSFRYGQRHADELAAAASVARQFEVAEHRVMDIDLRSFGGSALTSDIEVPKGRTSEEMGTGIPLTYVPARNTIFLSYALAFSEVLKTGDIFIGVNALDYSGYPDCRPDYIEAFEKMANLATKGAIEGACPITIHTPLIDWTKARIIETGTRLGVDYAQTISCYDPAPGGLACGRCDSCQLRRQGFEEAGIADPTLYQDTPKSGG